MKLSPFHVAAAVFAAALVQPAPHAHAQTFRPNPVRILVGAPPGGSNDIL